MHERRLVSQIARYVDLWRRELVSVDEFAWGIVHSFEPNCLAETLALVPMKVQLVLKQLICELPTTEEQWKLVRITTGIMMVIYPSSEPTGPCATKDRLRRNVDALRKYFDQLSQ